MNEDGERGEEEFEKSRAWNRESPEYEYDPSYQWKPFPQHCVTCHRLTRSTPARITTLILSLTGHREQRLPESRQGFPPASFMPGHIVLAGYLRV